MLSRKVKLFLNTIKYKIIEKSYCGAKYLYYPKESDTLLICFSAFPPANIRLYNNIKGFRDFSVDRLYINDTWGYKGSYYLFENGKTLPYILTCQLIENILSKKKYKTIITCGTSKGGSAAIIFGLKYKAKFIFSGACQYYIGDYLNTPSHLPILSAMAGKTSVEEMCLKLNKVIPELIHHSHLENIKDSITIHLIYSKLEHTYNDHILYLIQDLRKNNIKLVLKEYDFKNHSDVGRYYLQYMKEWFDKEHNVDDE